MSPRRFVLSSLLALATAAGSLASSVTPASASATQFTLFDEHLVHTAEALGNPTLSSPTNWVSPVNYAQGRGFLRLEITSKPSLKPTRVQMCMWRARMSIETCTPGLVLSTTGVYWIDLQRPAGWWKKNANWDFNIQPEVARIMFKDAADLDQLLMSKRCGAYCYKGPDLAQHVPIGYRASVVFVAEGQTLVPPAGWSGCPGSWSPLCTSPGVSPSIVSDPQSTTVAAGGRATFSATANGTSPLAYQWRRNGAVIPGATGASYTTGAVAAEDSGTSFDVVVTNVVGVDTSAPAVLTVTEPEPPVDGELQSDDFDGSALGSHWRIVDPVGDVTVTPSGGSVRVGVPAGTTHDLWTNTRSGFRMMQSAGDTDVTIEATFRDAPTRAIQVQGLLFEGTNGELLRFDLHRGSRGLRAYVGSVTTSGTTLESVPLTGSGSARIRVIRSGDQWTMQVARGAGSFSTVATVHHALTVDAAGIWVGTAGANPGLTTVVESFTVA